MTIKLLSLQETMPAIEKLAVTAKAVQEQIHIIACSCLAHVRDHGDYRPAQALLNALPNGQRVKGLVAWFRGFSSKKMSIKQDDKKSWVIALADERVAEDFKVTEAMEVTFADFTQEKNPESVTVESLIRNLTRTANNDENFEGTTTPKVSPEARAVAASLIASYRASQVKAA